MFEVTSRKSPGWPYCVLIKFVFCCYVIVDGSRVCYNQGEGNVGFKFAMWIVESILATLSSLSSSRFQEMTLCLVSEPCTLGFALVMNALMFMITSIRQL